MSELIKFETASGLNVPIEKPNVDEQRWVTIQQQSFTIDKSDYVLEKFKRDFSWINVDDYAELLDVINRSSILKDWYAKVSLEYADSIQLPLSVKDFFSPYEYKKQFEEIQKYRKNLAEQSLEIERAAADFDVKVRMINERYRIMNSEILTKSRMLPVLTMTIEQLPISLALLISKYRVAVEDDTNKTRIYARELLIQYQRSLLQVLRDETELDPQELINELASK